MNKKLLSLILSCVIMSIPTAAFAEGTTDATGNATPSITTTETTEGSDTTPVPVAKDNGAYQTYYSTVYMDKMTKIVEQRAQTKAAVEANEAVSSEIKKAYKGNTEPIEAQVKALRETIKNNVASAKEINQERIDLRQQLKSDIKAYNAGDMKIIQANYQALQAQASTLKDQIVKDRSSAKPLIAQLKDARDARKTLVSSVQTLIDQAKALRNKIVQEEAAKNQLWVTYKQNMQAKDYTAAGNTLQSIIDAKTQILSDINARGQILNQILSQINNSTTIQ